LDLYPIGIMSSGLGSGTIDSVSYSFFEPNVRCMSSYSLSSLITRFQNQTILARKKSNPFLTITYEYGNIYSSEYRQIEHFLYKKEDAVNSFYVVDLSKGELPTGINTSSTWTASVPNTKLYNTISNQKADYIFFYNGNNWKLGTITTVTANTSVVCNVDTNNYGDMTDAQGMVILGNRRTMIYPVYQCFAVQGSLNSLNVTDHWPNDDSERGYRYSGSITFITKYAT